MSVKNKAEVNKGIKAGGFLDNSNGWYGPLAKDPLKFANSDELRKIQNRNRKKR